MSAEAYLTAGKEANRLGSDVGPPSLLLLSLMTDPLHSNFIHVLLQNGLTQNLNFFQLIFQIITSLLNTIAKGLPFFNAAAEG